MQSKQEQLDATYLGTAILHSKLSKAKRKQVGAVLLTKQGVTLTGYNGTPTGLDNACEELKPQPFPNKPEYVTKPEVIHAELNCILKAAKEGISVIDSKIYVTLAPCIACSAMLVQCQVKEVVYQEDYRDMKGVELMKKAGINVRKY